MTQLTHSPGSPASRAHARYEWSWRTRIGLPVAALLVFIALATMGYVVLEPRYSWFDALYMTIITIATVGYQEVHPLSEWGRLWTLFVLVGGLVVGAVVISLIVAMVVEGQVRSIFGRRQLERKIAALSGHVILCGYGNMGALVCQELREAKETVVVVDSSPDRTAAAEKAGLLYILGDGQDETTLHAAGITQAGALITLLPTDAENVLLVLTARQANTSLRIIARASSESAQDKLLKAGASRVLCPTRLGATRMADLVLRPAVVDFVEMAHRGVELEMDELKLTPQSALVGKTLEELELPRRLGAHVIAISRADGQAIYHPTPELRLTSGDTLILVGRRGVAGAIQALQA